MKRRGISGVFKEITHVIRFGVRHHFQNRVKQGIFRCLVIGYWSGSFKYSRRVISVILPFLYPIILCMCNFRLQIDQSHFHFKGEQKRNELNQGADYYFNHTST